MTTADESISLREIMITKDGRVMSAVQWAKELGLVRATLRKRAERGLRGLDLIAPAQPRFGHAHAAQRAAKAKSELDA